MFSQWRGVSQGTNWVLVIYIMSSFFRYRAASFNLHLTLVPPPALFYQVLLGYHTGDAGYAHSMHTIIWGREGWNDPLVFTKCLLRIPA